jgi:hypothetical protein
MRTFLCTPHTRRAAARRHAAPMRRRTPAQRHRHRRPAAAARGAGRPPRPAVARRGTRPARCRCACACPEGDSACPLVLFSHGLGGSVDAGTQWAEAWAAAGVATLHLQHPWQRPRGAARRRPGRLEGGGAGRAAAGACAGPALRARRVAAPRRRVAAPAPGPRRSGRSFLRRPHRVGGGRAALARCGAARRPRGRAPSRPSAPHRGRRRAPIPRPLAPSAVRCCA